MKLAMIPLLAVLLTFAVLPLSCRAMGSGEAFLQGTWHHSGTLDPDSPNGGFSYFIEHAFHKGKYVKKGYPPIYEEGSYRVTEDGNDRVVLEITIKTESGETNKSTMTLTLDRQNGKINDGNFDYVKSGGP